MSNIRKKLLALACLYLVCSQVNAQVTPGSNRQPPPAVRQIPPNKPMQHVPPQIHDYSWYVEQFGKRMPDAKVANLRPANRTLGTNKYSSPKSYQYMQEFLAKRAPSFQQRRSFRTLSAQQTVPITQRPYSWYEQMARDRLEGRRATQPAMNQ